jgi:hypothetical protein
MWVNQVSAGEDTPWGVLSPVGEMGCGAVLGSFGYAWRVEVTAGGCLVSFAP